MQNNLPQDSWIRVGQTVRTIRELRGWTVDELASAILISRPYLSNIEGGRKPLTPVLLAKVAEALLVPQMAILRPEVVSA